MRQGGGGHHPTLKFWGLGPFFCGHLTLSLVFLTPTAANTPLPL